jgi:adenosine deaminase
MSRIAAFIEQLPKAELHLHLEGAVSPAFFARLRAKYGVADLNGTGTEAGQFPDLAAFLAVYGQVCNCMRDPDDFRDTTYEALQRAAHSGARYVELFFSPAAHDTVIDYRSMVDGIVAGMHTAREDFGLVARLIPAHNRELGLDRGMAFLDTVLRYRPPEVVGIGLDYAERPHPPAQFAPLFAAARAHGLQVTAHAGEDGPAEYVRDAIDAIRRMIDAGLGVTINTDDPGLFATTLNREYTLAAEAFGLSESMLAEIAANGLSHSWNPNIAQAPSAAVNTEPPR